MQDRCPWSRLHVGFIYWKPVYPHGLVKDRVTAKDSQSYGDVSKIMNDGNHVTFDSQEFNMPLFLLNNFVI